MTMICRIRLGCYEVFAGPPMLLNFGRVYVDGVSYSGEMEMTPRPELHNTRQHHAGYIQTIIPIEPRGTVPYREISKSKKV